MKQLLSGPHTEEQTSPWLFTPVQWTGSQTYELSAGSVVVNHVHEDKRTRHDGIRHQEKLTTKNHDRDSQCDT